MQLVLHLETLVADVALPRPQVGVADHVLAQGLPRLEPLQAELALQVPRAVRGLLVAPQREPVGEALGADLADELLAVGVRVLHRDVLGERVLVVVGRPAHVADKLIERKGTR